MKRQIQCWLFLVLTALLLPMMGCTRHIEKVSVPDSVGLDVYEVRASGAGPAPDSLKVYLIDRGHSVAKTDRPIFEGQDIGAVCYEWIGSNELHIRISGGYVDSIQPQWKDKDSGKHIVNVRYMGFEGCVWRSSGR